MTNKEAINFLKPMLRTFADGSQEKEVTQMAIEALSAEPVHGEWILSDVQRKEDTDNDNYWYVCSECGHSDLHSKSQEVPYCWCCGAKMEGK